MNVKENIIELIGNTPILKLNKIKEKYDLKGDIYIKLELLNPCGSVKDRVALSMLNNAKESGIIDENTTIIEPTSGNTGIGLASLSSVMGLRCILVMPESMSIERRKLLKAYGAELVLTDKSKGMSGAIAKAKELASEIPNSFIPSQFENPNNPLIHYLTTGKEIFSQMDGKIDYFTAGIGTGGTISGVGKYLKEQNPNIVIVGVEPKSSSVIQTGISGAHKIQGIGAGFIPKNLNLQLIDEMTSVTDEEAFYYAKELALEEGLLVGISTGASLASAIKIAKEKNGNIVTIAHDTGERYLSILMEE